MSFISNTEHESYLRDNIERDGTSLAPSRLSSHVRPADIRSTRNRRYMTYSYHVTATLGGQKWRSVRSVARILTHACFPHCRNRPSNLQMSNQACNGLLIADAR